MSAANTPRVRRTAQNTLLTYQLSRRIFDVKPYPIQSPQGASILLYGQENGVTIVWRGGKRLKKSKLAPKLNGNVNGHTVESVMVLDSDEEDEEPPPASTYVPAEFEDHIEKTSYPEIVQSLDLRLGTAVRKIAVPPLSPSHANDAPAGGFGILKDKMVFAVSCTTEDVYLITIPLTPPSSESKNRPEWKEDLLAGGAGSGAWGESLILLGGQKKHSDALAITFAKADPLEGRTKPLRAIVASCCAEASGVLRLWQMSLDPNTKTSRSLKPFQSVFLDHPIHAISFNPFRTTQLLTIFRWQGARIYDYALPAVPAQSDSDEGLPSQGSWLLSLFQPFVKGKYASTRKPILDGTWIVNGRAIFMLLYDGMWGIWDVDGVHQPPSGSHASTRSGVGLKGASTTSFNLSGYTEGTSYRRRQGNELGDNSSKSEGFVPMTPHTRKQASAAFGSTPAGFASVIPGSGGVSVITLPSTDGQPRDESVALWIGGPEHVCVIPAIKRFWDSQLRRGPGGGVNLFSGAHPTRMINLADLAAGLQGERCCGISLAFDPGKSGIDSVSDGGLLADLILQGDHRFTIAREAEEGVTVRKGLSGSEGDDIRRRLFSGERHSSAIVVHGQNKPSAFNMSTSRPGSLRQRPVQPTNSVRKQEPRSSLQGGSRAGLNFAQSMNTAADISTDLTKRDVEVEMLDIMDIDNALTSMEDIRGRGRKKVFFEDH